MLIAEIPSTFMKVSATQWSDPVSRTMYFVDPTDPLGLVSRTWNQTELDAYLSAVSVTENNLKTLSTTAKTSIQSLTNDIGLHFKNPDGTVNASLVAGATSLNAIIKDTKANINANPAAYITYLAQALKRTNKALIAQLKVSQGVLDSASVGAD